MGDRRRDEELRDLLHDSSSTPISWDRVHVIARRRSLITLVGLIALALLLTAIIVITTVAGKSALDSSFSPPILSHASVSMTIGQPQVGRGLTHFTESADTAATSSDVAPSELGYSLKADLEVEGLKGEPLTARWRLVRPGESRGQTLGTAWEERTIPSSNDDEETLRKWVPRPRNSGSYVVAVSLQARNGEKIASAESSPFYVVGEDCCSAYETKSYTAVLPENWPLEENYEPNPGSRYVTLARGPYENALVIDTSPHQRGSALDKANELEGLLASSDEGYRRIDRNLHRVDHHLVVEWSYEVEGDTFTDILFYRGPNGYAVLGRSDKAHFRETRDLARAVARSVRPIR
jgi:hypothetical protein